MRKLTHEELLDRQQQRNGRRFPFVVVLNNIRSLYNVGSIFRTADGIGIEKLYCCGITGIPPSNQISKTALGAEETVPWEYREQAVAVVRELKKKGYQIVLLEQTVSSVDYQEFQPSAPVCLVVGNEITGVADELIQLSDKSIEIEMSGLKNSLNVTVAFGVVAYRIRHRLKQTTPLS